MKEGKTIPKKIWTNIFLFLKLTLSLTGSNTGYFLLKPLKFCKFAITPSCNY